MPRKRVSDDIDHVPIDPKPSKILRKNPPPPPSPPKHIPILINNPLLHGRNRIPDHIKLNDAYSIFRLFFDDEILAQICQNTNNYAEFYPSKTDKPQARKWYRTTVPELRAYLGAWIWMGVYRSSDIEDYWNTRAEKGPVHERLRKAIALKRWQQIDRFLYISPPQDPTTPKSETPFDKLEPLNDHLRQSYKRYWATGTHLAVDKTIVRFMGRASETVNIPTKPIPEGFKIWVLANGGYVLDWLYYAKGDRLGPIDLDDFWTEDLGFSKTQAIVLDLVKQQGILNNF